MNGTKTDDPREILKAAGVECPELDALMTCDDDHPGSCGDCLLRKQGADALWCREFTMCALARLVAEQKASIERLDWMLHEAMVEFEDEWGIPGWLADLANRYAEQQAPHA